MADESDWSDAELQAFVAAYLEMLRLEHNHVPYSKAEVRRKLLASSLAQRNDGSIEYRMQNISFVMEAMGLPRIAGYKPARNVGVPTQQRLQRFVEEAGVSSLAKAEAPARLEEVVPAPDAIMGVKAVFGAISSHVLCFGARGTINERSYFSVAAGAARRAMHLALLPKIRAVPPLEGFSFFITEDRMSNGLQKREGLVDHKPILEEAWRRISHLDASSILGKDALKPLFASFPVGHQRIQLLIKSRTVMWMK